MWLKDVIIPSFGQISSVGSKAFPGFKKGLTDLLRKVSKSDLNLVAKFGKSLTAHVDYIRPIFGILTIFEGVSISISERKQIY